MVTHREKFKELLKKLFQFESAELDFGIYRIMNHKRAAIENFIEKDLLEGVTKELSSGALTHEGNLAQNLKEVAAQIRENFGEEALDADGNLAKHYHKTPRGAEYLELLGKARVAKSTTALEADIFNHLYTFFSRYYDDGDFLSLRRYSKRNKYAIPYNGEEVYVYWANSDQYYIKTAENFTFYSYKHNGWVVRFQLRKADVPHNNVKGAKRFFFPCPNDIVLDEKTHTLVVPFEYRSPSDDEESRYGVKRVSSGDRKSKEGSPDEKSAKGVKRKGQEAILADCIPAIIARAKKNSDALTALIHEKSKTTDGDPVSLLEHHLRVYTRKNTSDYFIHKDLEGFLQRELDFYIKNEVLNLVDLEAAQSESWFQTLHVIKSVGGTIISFLAEIENFQKRLFEKKKFVTETHYCVSLDRVPKTLYVEIIKNKAQIDEWKRLFHIHELKPEKTQLGYSDPIKIEFLNMHQHLVIDTKFFSREFEDALLCSKEFITSKNKTLDDALSGYALHSENHAALRLLRERFKGDLSCIYIDPPYNTGDDDFNYKDSYQSSSWLSMMQQSTINALELLKEGGAFFASCDENEFMNLGCLLRREFGEANQVETIVWNKRGLPPVRAAFLNRFISPSLM